MKKYKWILKGSIIILLLNASIARANIDTSGYKFSFYGGWQKNILRPTSFTLIGNETEQLAPDHKSVTGSTWGLGSAYRFLTPNHKNIFYFTHDVSIGLDVFYFQASQNGTVLDFGQSPDFNYRLKVQSLRFLGNVEWTFLPITSKQIYPFIEAGAGLASNVNYYHDAPIQSGGVGIVFSRRSIIQLAYDLGAGLKFMPKKNIEVSFRYLYSDLGAVRSGIKTNLAVSSQYSIPLKTQSVLLGLSYLA